MTDIFATFSDYFTYDYPDDTVEDGISFLFALRGVEPKVTGAGLVYATTTPVVPGTLNPLRTPEAPIEYNEAATKIMQATSLLLMICMILPCRT